MRITCIYLPQVAKTMLQIKKIIFKFLKIYLWILVIGGGIGGGIVLAAFLMGQLGGKQSGDTQGLGGVQVGEQNFIGRANCDRAIKKNLLDPDSYQRDGAEIIEAKPEAWVARTWFRSRNGFGGYAQASALCVFDGKTYEAMVEQ